MEKVFGAADICLPKKGINMEKWSVVACDQFTSEPEYWKETEEIVEDAPSTLKMILPEVYLDGEDEEERLQKIGETMKTYLEEGILEEYPNAMIYVRRTDSTGKVREGIVGCIDLEQYDYHKGSHSPVRATEATVEERIPARIRVRENALLELPHIMILIDDKEKNVVEPCEAVAKAGEPLYDFSLMQKGGRLQGYLLGQEEQARILSALDQLSSGEGDLVFAMGDGNHSLASAKAFYERMKKQLPPEEYLRHPARYALAEIVNLHSPALEFEAIHRIVTEVDVQSFLEEMTKNLGLVDVGETDRPEEQQMIMVRQGKKSRVAITRPTSKLTVGSLQNFLDEYQKDHPVKMDYIHGEETVLQLSMEENSMGFLLPQMRKEELFPTVMADGALPRKTFSMGHAQDKRYYTECRKIR